MTILKDAASDVSSITTAISTLRTERDSLKQENTTLKATIQSQYDQLTQFEASLQKILKALGL